MDFQNYNQIFNSFKEPYRLNIYNKKNKLVIKNILNRLMQEKESITELLKEENESWGRNYSINKLYQTIDKFSNYELKKDRMFGIGNIVAIQTGDPCLYLELILNTIIANCKIMMIANPTLVNFNLYITSIIREELKKENIDENNISIVEMINYMDVIKENEAVIDCVIINKDYDEYSYFAKEIICKVIYLDYGNINVYYDSNDFSEQIKEIANKSADVDLDAYDYKIKDMEEFLKNEKNNFIFNTAVILSKDLKKCMRLYEVIKAKNIFINTFDINKIETGLDINDLLFEKKIIIEDGK